jgi:hypothetical protein
VTPLPEGFGSPSEDEHRAKRDIYGVNIVEAPDEDGQARAKRLVNGIGAAVAIAARRVMARLGVQPETVQRSTEGVQDATELATSAVTGKLEGASLEGEFKRAQIAEHYANARRANAEAGKIEADTAWSDLERCIDLAQRLGAPVGVSKLPDGRLCISLGEGPTAQLPALGFPVHLSTESERTQELVVEGTVAPTGSLSSEALDVIPDSTPRDDSPEGAL